MKIFQIGAAGGIGRRLALQLFERGDEVTGMHRAAAQADTIRAAHGFPVTGDLISDTVEELSAKIRGHDAVVFSAGAHGTGTDKTTLIDGQGLEKAADAAALAGVHRLVLVSVFPDASREQQPNENFEHYMRVKKSADRYLTSSELDWLVVRPSVLIDAPGDGRVEAGFALEYGSVHRDNVAAFIAAALHEPSLTHTIVELNDGHEPAADAVARLAGVTTRKAKQ